MRTRQQAMRQSFLGSIDFPVQAEVLEVGCGTGVLARVLARWPKVGRVVGVDPATSLIQRARALADGIANLVFEEADARSLPFRDGVFDVAVFDSTLSHVPGVEQALEQARRVLRPAGCLAVFDGDYATTTVAITDHDPMRACVSAMMASSVNDRRVMRRLPALLGKHGFEVVDFRSHWLCGYGGRQLHAVRPRSGRRHPERIRRDRRRDRRGTQG